MSFELTAHATIRFRQRGIRNIEAYLVLLWGDVVRRGRNGVEFIQLVGSCREARRDARLVGANYDSMKRVQLRVSTGGQVITAVKV